VSGGIFCCRLVGKVRRVKKLEGRNGVHIASVLIDHCTPKMEAACTSETSQFFFSQTAQCHFPEGRILQCIFFSVAQQFLIGRGLLIVEASLSHADTTLGRTPLDEESARHIDVYLTTNLADIHTPGGIRTRNPTKRAGADQPHRSHGHWDRRVCQCLRKYNFLSHFIYGFLGRRSCPLLSNGTVNVCAARLHKG
jgi:hypothetical protein